MTILESIELILTTSSTTGILGWLIGRRRNRAETRSIEINNIEKSAKVWQDYADSLTIKLNELMQKLDKQMEENFKLKQSLNKIKHEMDIKTNQYNELLKKNEQKNHNNICLCNTSLRV